MADEGEIMFVRRKRPQLRCTRVTEEEGEEEANSLITKEEENVVSSIRELQQLRKRTAGLSHDALLTGKKIKEAEIIVNDPFKMKTGGLTVMKGNGKALVDEEEQVKLSRNFASETNKRDEDADMLKFIEQELAKRKGVVETDKSGANKANENLLNQIPDDLKPTIGQAKEDMLSNQMLCGIPEVDLGVEAKMKNIEATEEAKQKLLKSRVSRRQNEHDKQLAPSNMSVNFVQHSRWNNKVNEALDEREANAHRTMLQVFMRDNQTSVKAVGEDDTDVIIEKRNLEAEKATDAIALQRYKAYTRNRKKN